MIRSMLLIEKFGAKGEKSGWTYVLISAALAAQLQPDMRQSFRVKGTLDAIPVEYLALVPLGDGNFILPLKSDLRRKLRKQAGAMLALHLEYDNRTLPASADFLACLEDEPNALAHFLSLPGSHQRYYHKWIEAAKTDATKARRIAQAIQGLCHQLDFGSMMKRKQ